MFGALRATLPSLKSFSTTCLSGSVQHRALHRVACASTSTGATASALLSRHPVANSLLQRHGATRLNSTSSILSKVSLFSARNGRTSNLLTSQARFFSSNSSPSHPLPNLSRPSVAMWLLSCSTLVFAIVVVGGVTRLTESGLSITEWRPITGVLPPLSRAQWEEEFDKYKLTPEFKLLNHSINLEEFKSIFYMEWGHRVLGRLLGVVFVAPLAYFALKRKLTPGMSLKLTGMALLIGAQGLMGWYMVKSGLEESLMTTPGAIPRVSQYRLAAHLALAFALYAGMFHTGLSVFKDWKFAHGRGAEWLGRLETYNNPVVKRFWRQSVALTALVLVTAISGAFVAGLDAGLVYNEFPLMAGRLAPPTDELFSPAYAKAADKSDLWWRNLLENPTTVQFNHRVLAMSTYISTCALYATTLRGPLRTMLPPVARTSILAAFIMANVQVTLGISTLLFMVPVSLAAAHQAGSVMLLSTMLHVLLGLRRPGSVSRAWREVYAKAGASAGGGSSAAASKAGAANVAGGGKAANAIRDATTKKLDDAATATVV